MEEIVELGSPLRCRLCGITGFHSILWDILKNNSRSAPQDPNALNEKIFRCVGIRVARNDRITTKICENCCDKIDEFVLFRQTCAATDILLRNALSQSMGQDATHAWRKDGSSAKRAHSDRNKRMPARSRGSFTLPSTSAREVWTDDTAVEEHTNIAQRNNRESILTILVTDDESGNEVNEGQANFDDSDSCDKDIVVGKTETASKKSTDNIRKFMLKCQYGVCKERFDSQGARIYHMQNYHAGTRSHECHLCNRCFSGKQKMQEHFDSAHAGFKRFPCQTCLKRFFRERHLKKHIDAVHKDIRPFKCRFRACPKGFTASFDLKRHIDSVHKGLRPFQCSFRTCPMGFTRSSHLKRHIDAVHKGLRPFRCPFQACPKRFSVKGGVQRHIKSIHT